MKIGKFKKILVAGLVCALSFGLITSTEMVNAVEGDTTQTQQDSTEGIELNKTATYVGDNKYKITLDAFTTGEVTTETSSKPLDIVLVLDQSGSMADPFEYGYNYEYVKYEGTYGAAYNQPVYHNSNGEYHELEVIRNDRFGNSFACDFTFRCNECNQVIHQSQDKLAYKYTGVLFWGYLGWPDDSQIFTKKTNTLTKSKVSALQESAKNFVSSVRTDASKFGVDHKISVVGFASETGYGNNTEILSIDGRNSAYDQDNYVGVKYKDLTDGDYRAALRNCNDSIIDKSISALASYGATRSDLGMKMAKNIFDANGWDEERQQVVIMFTDGEPTSGNQFENEVADATIKTAQELKNKGAKVYTIGIFNGAKPDSISDQNNKFMNYTSSNYLDVLNMNSDGHRVSSNYYYSASNADELKKVFEQISQDISEPSIELGSSAVIKDTISDYFQLVNESEKYPRTVEQLKYIGMGGNSYQFNEEESIPVENLEIEPSEDGKYITVSGYDFDSNYVRTENGVNEGYKLRISFYVEPIDGFIGGLSVPTNGADSGLYENESALETTPLKSFNIPTVDVDINYDFSVESQGMYVGNSWDDVEKFFKATDDGVPYSISGKNYNTNNNYVNDFVNIVYTIKVMDKTTDPYITKTVGTYTINAKDPTGTLSLDDSFVNISKKFRETQDFIISVNVENSNNTQSTTDEKVQQEIHIGEQKNTKLYIYVPTINTHDTRIDLGNDDNLQEHIDYNKTNDWTCNDSSITDTDNERIINSLGTVPELSFEISPSYTSDVDNINNDTFTPDTVGLHEFNVTIQNKNTDEYITDATISEHSTSHCTNTCSKKHFFVEVIGGSIIIKKEISNSDKIDLSDGEPTFTFKIEKKVDGSYKTIGYKTIRMIIKNENWEQNNEIVFNGLSAGEYRVTELKTLRYNIQSVTVNCQNMEEDNGAITFEIGGENNNTATVKYTNSVSSSAYESDGNGLINKFENDGTGKIVVNPERLYEYNQD